MQIAPQDTTDTGRCFAEGAVKFHTEEQGASVARRTLSPWDPVVRRKFASSTLLTY